MKSNRKTLLISILVLILCVFINKPNTAGGQQSLEIERDKFISDNYSNPHKPKGSYAFLLERKNAKEREVFAATSDGSCFIINEPRGYLHNYPTSDYPDATALVLNIFRLLPTVEKQFKNTNRASNATTGFVTMYLIGTKTMRKITISESSLKNKSNQFNGIYKNMLEIKKLLLSTLD